jgi:hypothetical protein
MRNTRTPCLLAAATLSLALAGSVFAQTDMTLLVQPWKDDQVVEATAEGLLYSDNKLEATNKDVSFYSAESSGRYRLDTSRELNPTVGYDWTHIQTNANGTPVPSSLDDLSLAVASPLAKVGDWFVGAMAGVGYAGDNAFAAGRGWYGIGNVMAGTELGKDQALILFIDYNGNRTLLPDVPTPGFAYSAKWGDNFTYVVGLPDSYAHWTPSDELEFELAIDTFTSVDFTARYKFTHDWQLFGKFSKRENAFSDSSLPENRRLFYLEDRVEAGVGYAIGKNLSVEAAVGYAFDRKFETGFDDRNLHHLTSISDSPYARVGFALRF